VRIPEKHNEHLEAVLKERTVPHDLPGDAGSSSCSSVSQAEMVYLGCVKIDDLNAPAESG
jgi:hypothetical protein